MAAPTYTPGAVGGLLTAVSLAASKNVAVFLDYSTKIEGQVSARVSTGGASTASTYTKHEGYFSYGATTITGSVVATGTSIVVASATGIAIGAKIMVENEVRTISNVVGTTITIDALQNNHSSGVAVYLMEDTPTYAGTNAMGGTINKTFARTTFLATGKWVFVLTNTDGANAVTAELTQDTIDSFA